MQINVFLRITKKREDGYHDLASLFHVSNEIFLFDVDHDTLVWLVCHCLICIGHLDTPIFVGHISDTC